MTKTRNRAWSLVLALALCFSLIYAGIPSVQAADLWWEQYMDNPEDDLTAPGVDANGQVTTTGGYILFTSDSHSCGWLAKDLLEFANKLVQEDTGDPNAYVGLFAHGGDFADSGLLPDVMTTIKHAIEDTSPNTVAVFTKGNHENDFDDEAFREITGMPRIGETAINADGLYHFFSFGMTENQTFTQEDIDTLAAYLAEHDDGKPVFVISHFPIHYLNSMRTVYDAGAKELLDVLNQYPQVVFTWGHNHSEADPSYGTVRFPGETLTYGPTPEDTVELNFTYMSNGSLRFGVNQENGCLVKVGEDGSLEFRFISLDQTPISDEEFEDSAGATYEKLEAGDVKVVADITRDSLTEDADGNGEADYYETINAAQAFVPRPKVNKTPAALDEVTIYDDRYEASEIEWSVADKAFDGAAFDFDTAYTATVTLKAKDGYTFADDIVDQLNSAVNPAYHGPMDDTYTTGGDKVTRVDDTTLKIENVFDNTVKALDPPLDPATEIVEGHRYVLASIDDSATSAYYKYEYQEGARRQSYRIQAHDVVVADGKLASETDPHETFTAVKDVTGYILYSDASLLDQEYGENSLDTINILNMYYRRSYEMETAPGDIYIYNNWNIDENGLPYVETEGSVGYPCFTSNAVLGTAEPSECNMRLFDLGPAEDAPAYIIEANVTAPVTGKAVISKTESGDPVTWEPADTNFAPSTVYTATVTVALDTPITDELNVNAAIGRMNGKDVDLVLSDDGQTATLTFTFPETNPNPVAMIGKATKADALEDGATYIILADGKAISTDTTDDGRYFTAKDIAVADGAITEGITDDMLFTVEAAPSEDGTEGLFYVKGSRGYLIGRQETEDGFGTWGITFSDEPAMTVSYGIDADSDSAETITIANGIYTKDTGVSSGMSFGTPQASYFYVVDGHVNHSDIYSPAEIELYKVEEIEEDPVQPEPVIEEPPEPEPESEPAASAVEAEPEAQPEASASEAEATQPTAEEEASSGISGKTIAIIVVVAVVVVAAIVGIVVGVKKKKK